MRDFLLYFGLLLFGFFTHDIFFSQMRVINLLAGKKPTNLTEGESLSGFSLPFGKKAETVSKTEKTAGATAAQTPDPPQPENRKFDPNKKYFYRVGSSVQDMSGADLQDPQFVKRLLAEGQIIEASTDPKEAPKGTPKKKKVEEEDSGTEGLVLGSPESTSTQAVDVIRALKEEKKRIREHAKALKELENTE